MRTALKFLHQLAQFLAQFHAQELTETAFITFPDVEAETLSGSFGNLDRLNVVHWRRAAHWLRSFASCLSVAASSLASRRWSPTG